MKAMKDAGMSYAEVGVMFQLSRQRAYQILRPKKYTPPTSEEVKERKRNWTREYHRNNVLTIKGKFTIVRKRPRPNDTCELCGQHRTRLHYHHWDDGTPELGMWICRGCHWFAGDCEKDKDMRYAELKDKINSGSI